MHKSGECIKKILLIGISAKSGKKVMRISPHSPGASSHLTPNSRRAVTAGRLVTDPEVLAGLEAGEQVATDPIAAGIELKQQR